MHKGRLSSLPILTPAYLLVLLAIIAYIIYFYVYNVYAFALFQFPFDYDQGEGFELLDVVMFSQGQWPYRDANAYPFYNSNYPPVYHLVIVPLVMLFGPQYWTGRVVSYVGTLITALCLGIAVQREQKRRWLSLISGLSFLGSVIVYAVGPLFRQHLFMVMFETLAIVLLAITLDKEKETGKKQTKLLLLVMVMLLLAGYTKQLAYATVIAAFLILFIDDKRRAITWGVVFGAVTGLIFLLINIATDGHWFTATVTANVNEFIDGQAKSIMTQWFNTHSMLAVVGVIATIWQWRKKRLSVYAIWFMVSLINSALTVGKWGAGISYLATTIAASCILVGMLFGELLKWSEDKRPITYALSLSLVALLFLFQAEKSWHMPTHTPFLYNVAKTLNKPVGWEVAPQTGCSDGREKAFVPYFDHLWFWSTLVGRPPTLEDTLAGVEIAEIVAQGKTAAFSEDAGFNFFLQRDIVSNPTQLLNLYKANEFDPTEMVAMLEAQSFDTVILRAQFYPGEVLQKIGEKYQANHYIEMNGFVYCIFQPKEIINSQ